MGEQIWMIHVEGFDLYFSIHLSPRWAVFLQGSKISNFLHFINLFISHLMAKEMMFLIQINSEKFYSIQAIRGKMRKKTKNPFRMRL